MSFTELALFIWAIGASVVASVYVARCNVLHSMFNMAVHMQIRMMDDTALYERTRAKYVQAKESGELRGVV